MALTIGTGPFDEQSNGTFDFDRQALQPHTLYLEDGQVHPFNLVPIIVSVWLLMGATIYTYFRMTDLQRLNAALSVLVEGEERRPSG